MKTKVQMNFKSLKVNSKGNTEITLETQGELTPKQILALHKLRAEGTVYSELTSAQMDIEDVDGEDYEEPHRGVPYTVQGGQVAVQMVIDEVPIGEPIHIESAEVLDPNEDYDHAYGDEQPEELDIVESEQTDAEVFEELREEMIEESLKEVLDELADELE